MNRTLVPLITSVVALSSTPALATQFITVVDPVTGTSSVFVSSGTIQPSNNTSPVIVPSQQITFSPQPPDTRAGVIDADDFVKTASPEIIEAFIKNKSAVDQENQRRLQNTVTQTSPAQSPSGAQKQPGGNPSDLSKVAENLDRLLGNIAQDAVHQKNPGNLAGNGTSPPADPNDRRLQERQDAINRMLQQIEADRQRQGLAGAPSKPGSMDPSAPASNTSTTAVLTQSITNKVMQQTRPIQQLFQDRVNSLQASDALDMDDKKALEEFRKNVENALFGVLQASVDVALNSALQGNGTLPSDKTQPAAQSGNSDPEPVDRSKGAAGSRDQRKSPPNPGNDTGGHLEGNGLTRGELVTTIVGQSAGQDAASDRQKPSSGTDRTQQPVPNTGSLIEQIQEQMRRQAEQNRQAATQQAGAGKKPDGGNSPPLSIAEILRQAAQDFRETNSRAGKQPGAGKNPPGTLPPSKERDFLLQSIAKLEAMLGTLDQLPGGKPGKGTMSDAQRQAVLEKLTKLIAMYVELSIQPGKRPDFSKEQATFVALIKEITAKLTEQSEYSRNQLMNTIQLAAKTQADPWASYIYVNRNEPTTTVPTTALYGGATAYYEGLVKGQVGGSAVNGRLNMSVNLTPGSNAISGSMNFPGQGSLSVLPAFSARTGGQFSGELGGAAFGGNVEGSFNGKLFGPQAQQIGGAWDVTVYRPGSTVTGGGQFAGAQVAPPGP